ncbi:MULTISPECIES: fructose-bisphosphate aldolase [unclassified Pseudomonas]|uniref:fructose-bisphosphate aldolase n=1 Tax=unclassified Pseudomonas TaxID=196821 RepID=UPI001CBE9092|nr:MULTISPECIES: fructose-bisphosphate aldolase [unclassified Pseudomonas]
MTTHQSINRFTPLTPIATTQPVLFIDKTAPLTELHACATLRDSAASDFNTLTNVARILVQDVTDVFGVIE